jgi:hypothetical protein
MLNLIYINIGPIQNYIFDNIYNTLTISPKNVKIYILLEDIYIDNFNNILQNFKDDLSIENVTLIPLSILDKHSSITQFNNHKYLDDNKRSLKSFRDGFWIYTIKRFFYLHAFIDIFKLFNNIHIENDVILTYDLNKIDKSFFNKKLLNIVKDTKTRCIPSFLYVYDTKILFELIEYLLKRITNVFENDMVLLGEYDKVHLLNNNPDSKNKYYVDGASLGQYLNGIDFKNIKDFEKLDIREQKRLKYTNQYKHFINETSDIDISKYKIEHDTTLFHIINKQNSSQIILNIHLHSKQLYFYNKDVIQYKDIITGDRILTLCDYIILHKSSYDFHKIPIKEMEKIGKIIVIKDDSLNLMPKKSKIIWDDILENHKREGPVKLCIYSHFLPFFKKHILPHLTNYPTLNIILYTHNSDDVFDNSFMDIVNHKQILFIYAQNLNIVHEKCKLLPIGIANSMWKHGDLISLYDTIIEKYKFKKENKQSCVYINIKPNTFLYRKEILDNISLSKKLILSTNKPYKNYLDELSSYKYCLCIRGNGIDCHRFYECLYLNVIPILINNSYTNCEGFIQNLKKQNISFIEITENNTSKIIKILEDLNIDNTNDCFGFVNGISLSDFTHH